MVTVNGSIVYPLVALLNSSIVTSLESMHVDMLIGRPLIANHQCSHKASPNGGCTIQSQQTFGFY